jgi:hypothetical protein
MNGACRPRQCAANIGQQDVTLCSNNNNNNVTNNIVLQADISLCTGPVIVYCPKGAAQTFVTKYRDCKPPEGYITLLRHFKYN